jgi:hypothetical protein
MTTSRLISCAARLTALSLLTFTLASRAADPLRPDASEQVSLLRPLTLIPSWNLGPLAFRPELSAGGTYDDNIALAPNGSNRKSDMIWTVSPTLSLVADKMYEGYGTYLRLDYSPSFLFFQRHTNNDTVDQHANFAASWVMSKLSLGVKQRFDETKDGVIEVGRRLRVRDFNTELDSKYKLGDKTSVELNPRLTVSETSDLVGYTEWGADSFLNRQLSSKVTGSLGGSGGYVDPTDGPIQTYERALVRLSYAVTGKVQLDANGGAEWRQYNSSQSATTIPVFGIGAAWHPFEGTTITLAGHRRDEISAALTNEDYTATGVDLSLRQRVLTDRLHVTVRGAYENRNYHSVATSTTTGSRNDDLYLARAEVELALVHHFTVSAFYQYQKDDSNESGSSFSDNQFGFQGTWKL